MTGNGNDVESILEGLSGPGGIEHATMYLEAHWEALLDDIINIAEIPSPSFAERDRGVYVAERMKAFGLDAVGIDSMNNVVGRYRGQDPVARLLIVAHLDSVFPVEVDTRVTRRKDRLQGPGIGDNATSVAVLLHLIAAWQSQDYLPPFDILISANAAEEGLGDLKGIRHLLDEAEQSEDAALEAVLSLDGHLGAVVNAGIGSRRLKVSFTAMGGHSWGDFGAPSAIHTLGTCIHDLCQIDVPLTPRTTYNVGVIRGGTSVNTIAEYAEMVLDLRSASASALRGLEDDVRQRIKRRCDKDVVEYLVQVVGDRPSGQLSPDHAIVQLAKAIGGELDLRLVLRAGSTDANIPLSRGMPAITLGVYSGRGAHREKEMMFPDSLRKGFPLAYGVARSMVMWAAKAQLGRETANGS